MDWNDLRYLLAIHRRGSLAAAAKELGVTKATASRRLAALEEALGVELAQRTPDGVVLTDAGKKAVAAAEEMDQSTAGLRDRLRVCAEDAVRGAVRLTAPQWLAERLFLAELPALKQRHPNLEVEFLGTNAVLDVARREADVALRNVRPTQQSLVFRKAGVLSGHIYGSKLYLERRGRPQSREQLSQHDLLVYAGLGGMPGFEWLAEPALAARVVFRANDPVGLRSAAAAGLGLAALPSILGDEDAALERVDALGIGHTDMFLVMPEALQDSRAVRAVVDFVESMLGARSVKLLG
jgi:molybdate transport repressor ModE-like protein